MTTHRQQGKATARDAAENAIETVKDEALNFKQFVKKVYNDWTLHQTQALTYVLVTALVPIAILLLGIVGWILNGLDHNAYNQMLQHISSALPKEISSKDAIDSATNKLGSASILVTFLALLTALFFGSRLYTLLEACFDLIFHVPPRSQGKKNLMAIIMTLVTVILVPFLVLASLLPVQIVDIISNSSHNQNTNAWYSAAGTISSIIVSFVLFLIIYAVVPNNQGDAKTRVRTSWRGAFTASLLLQLILIISPRVIPLFNSGYVGQLAFALVLLVFFYLISLIILLGAQVNAFYVKHIPAPREDLITRSSRSR